MSRGVVEEPVDVDVRRTVWNGSVPVMFSLAASEVSGTATPRPLFVCRLKSWYLPIVSISSNTLLHLVEYP